MNLEFDKLDLLLVDLFDVGLDAPRTNELCALLAADPEARRRYIDDASFHALLEWQSGPLFSLRDGLAMRSHNDPGEAMVLPAISDEEESESTEPAVAPETPTPATERPAARLLWSLLSLRGVGLAAAILIAISLGIAVMVHLRKPQIVATLVNAEDAQWKEGFAPHSGGTAIAEGEQLSLENGSIDIAFGGGASVTIQAPAQFCLNNAGTMTFTSGCMAAVVSEKARGFTVSTPDAIVKDLGTEFGLRCGPTTDTEIQVFMGTVQASLRSANASPVTLVAGQSARVSAGALTTANAAAITGAFPRHLRGVNLPPGFDDQDIGKTRSPGAAEYSAASGQWTISAMGHDTWLARDQFNMVDKQLAGDATIVCRILTPTTEADGSRSGASKCGIMFRTSLSPESQFVSVVYTESLGVQMLSRDISATNATTNGLYATSEETPLWLKLSRAGDKFTGSYSRDGVNWVTISTHSVNMPTTLRVGLMLSSHNFGHVGTAIFTDVAIKGDAPVQ